MRTFRKRAGALASTLLFAPGIALADTNVTWIGPSGGSWDVASNWSDGVGPVDNSNVFIDQSPANKSVVVAYGASFSTLTIDAGDSLIFAKGSGGSLGPAIANSGTIHFEPDDDDDDPKSDSYFLSNGLTLTGGGTVSVDRRLSIFGFNPQPLVNVDNTIRGSLVIYSNLENHGTIIFSHASGSVIGDGAEFINAGVVTTEPGINLGLYTFMANQSGMLEAADGSEIVLSSGVRGGTLRTSGTGIFSLFTRSNISRLTDVTLDGVYRFGDHVSGNTQVTELIGSMHNTGTIIVAPPGGKSARLSIVRGESDLPFVLSGGGTVLLAGFTASINSIGTWTSDNTIAGFGSISGFPLINHGTIMAQPGGTLSMSVKGTNTGTLRAEPGGHLRITGTASIDSTGGAVRISSGGSLSMASTSTLIAGSIELDGLLTMSSTMLTAAGITGAGALNQTAGQINAQHLRLNSVLISSGTTKITADGGTAGTSRLTSLSITGPGKLDLTNHDLILDYLPDAPIDPTTIRALLASAYAGGAWTGPGLTSSEAGASISPNKTALGYLDNTGGEFTEFSGQAMDDSSILVKYTLMGDANFDQAVNVYDLLALATHWQSPGFWEDGDFNYDGVVNAADLGLLAINWNGNLALALTSAGLEGVSVPEPLGPAVTLLYLAAGLACGERGRTAPRCRRRTNSPAEKS